MTLDVAQKIADEAYVNPLSLSDGRTEWREKNREIKAQFFVDVAKEFDAERFPFKQWQKLCDMAWSEGHADGFSAVLWWVEYLVELLEIK